MTSFFKWLKSYTFKVFIGIDQFANAFFAPVLNGIMRAEMKLRGKSIIGLAKFGYPDETLSSVFGKNRDHNKFCAGIAAVLDFLDTDHSLDAIEADEGRKYRG